MLLGVSVLSFFTFDGFVLFTAPQRVNRKREIKALHSPHINHKVTELKVKVFKECPKTCLDTISLKH